MSTPIIPGAEPISVTEGIHGGVLLLHGYTGTPQQIRPWAEAFAQAGFAVEAPLLPGHGTLAEEMIDTQWSDYIRCAEDSYRKLAERYQRVFIGGLCLGGNMAAWLAVLHPATTAGLIVINGQFKVPRRGTALLLHGMVKGGKKFFTWSTLPKQVEDPLAPAVLAYLKVPIAPMLSMEPARKELSPRLNEICCPVLVFTSLFASEATQPPEAIHPKDPWYKNITGPVEHILLERSNHVATLDYDKEIIEARSIAFALEATTGRSDLISQESA